MQVYITYITTEHTHVFRLPMMADVGEAFSHFGHQCLYHVHGFRCTIAVRRSACFDFLTAFQFLNIMKLHFYTFFFNHYILLLKLM